MKWMGTFTIKSVELKLVKYAFNCDVMITIRKYMNKIMILKRKRERENEGKIKKEMNDLDIILTPETLNALNIAQCT